MWDWLVVIAKTITYATTLRAAGGVMFLSYSHSLLQTATAARIRRSIARLMVGAVIASVCKMLLTAGSLGGGPEAMIDAGLVSMTMQGGGGWAFAARLIGLACIVCGGRLRLRPLALAGAIAAATSFAWVGHVHALAAPPLPTLFLSLHLLCIAFWLGALDPLYAVTGEESVAAMALVVSRFGMLALGVVGVLVAAGTGLLLHMLSSLSDLWGSEYGRLAVLKIGLVAALLAIAAVNRLRATPRLRAHDSGAVAALRRKLAVEMALGWAILGITAALTTLSGPPR